MLKYIVFIISLFIFCNTAYSYDTSKFNIDYTEINKSSTTVDLLSTSGSEYERADSTMKQIFSEIMEKYKDNIEFIPVMKKAQEAWENFRDLQLESIYPGPEEKKQSLYGREYWFHKSIILAELTWERAKALYKWLDPNEPSEGSIGMMERYDIFIMWEEEKKLDKPQQQN